MPLLKKKIKNLHERIWLCTGADKLQMYLSNNANNHKMHQEFPAALINKSTIIDKLYTLGYSIFFTAGHSSLTRAPRLDPLWPSSLGIDHSRRLQLMLGEAFVWTYDYRSTKSTQHKLPGKQISAAIASNPTYIMLCCPVPRSGLTIHSYLLHWPESMQKWQLNSVIPVSSHWKRASCKKHEAPSFHCLNRKQCN